ncbi:hypothetical protein CK203_090871 [Vitis vinifera]|uniref:Uncharacterized protein n=1 Tax=Vitis vinifera TaxID=29760 RepID=A0A438CMS8_VITVI|nr:hypothetical protein CK203_090871 [Vitis vinifera]
MQGKNKGERKNRVKKTEDSSYSLLAHFWSSFRSPFCTFYIPFQSSGSQESNASNGVQFGVEMKELQPLQADHSKLKEAFCKVLHNQPFWKLRTSRWKPTSQPYEDSMLLRSDFAAPLECLRNLPDTIFSCEMVPEAPRYFQPNSEDFSSEDERLSFLSLGVINFVDYSLNQGAPAGHELAETPSGHESNGAVAGDRTPNQMVSLPLPLLGTNQMAPLPGMVPLYSDITFLDCTCHIEYEIAEEAMNFMSYVAEVSREWDEPNARDMGRMTSQPNAKGEMYMLNDGIDMKAEIAAMERRLEKLEMTNMQPVQAISQTPLQAMPCAICLSYEHFVDECPTIPAEREMFGNCNTYNSNWRDHPNFSWKTIATSVSATCSSTTASLNP